MPSVLPIVIAFVALSYVKQLSLYSKSISVYSCSRLGMLIIVLSYRNIMVGSQNDSWKTKIRSAPGQRKIAEVGLEGHLGFLHDVVKT